MSAILYFAYGSNLDEGQLRGRCPGARFQGVARLPDHALGFAGRSARRNGAVATVVRAPGQEVRGVLWRLTLDDCAGLDRREGHPDVYERVVRPVRDGEGRERAAAVYVRDAERGAVPSCEYLAQIERAYARFGFDPSPLWTAALAGAEIVFVYGSLLPGEANSGQLEHALPLGPATTAPGFGLVDLGAYPGLVEAEGECVKGERFAVDVERLAALDRFEGVPELYRRVRIALASGEEAWAYLLTHPEHASRTISGGDWRAHRLRR